MMPDISGVETLQRHSRHKFGPSLLTADAEEDRLPVLSWARTDYIAKPYYARIAGALKRSLRAACRHASAAVLSGCRKAALIPAKREVTFTTLS